jgi:hypothetical protein
MTTNYSKALQEIRRHIVHELTPFMIDLEKVKDCSISIEENWLPSVEDEQCEFNPTAMPEEFPYVINVNGYFSFAYALQLDDNGVITHYIMEGTNDHECLHFDGQQQAVDSWEDTKKYIYLRLNYTLQEVIPFIEEAKELVEERLGKFFHFDHYTGNLDMIFVEQKEGSRIPSRAIKVLRNGDIYQQLSPSLKWRKI